MPIVEVKPFILGWFSCYGIVLANFKQTAHQVPL
jgi:hypothetical protein